MLGIKKLFSSADKSESVSVSHSPYITIGGEDGVRALANAFYDEMETNVHLQELLAVHQLPLDNIREKFFKYLSGWLGGPALYEQEYGHPRLRMRHMHVKVTSKQRDLWLLCMRNALDKTCSDQQFKRQLMGSFVQLASHLVNAE